MSGYFIRPFVELADKMLEIVPKRERPLRVDINKARESSIYSSPEAQGMAYEKMRITFVCRWGDKLPRSAWGKEIHRMWKEEIEKANKAFEEAQATARTTPDMSLRDYRGRTMADLA